MMNTNSTMGFYKPREDRELAPGLTPGMLAVKLAPPLSMRLVAAEEAELASLFLVFTALFDEDAPLFELFALVPLSTDLQTNGLLKTSDHVFGRM